MKRVFMVFFALLLTQAWVPAAFSESNMVDEFGNKSDVITNSQGELIPAPEILRPCGVSVTKQCIKSITATDDNNVTYIAKPSGTSSYQWQSGLLVKVPDWELINKKFSYGSNLFGISISQIPNDLQWRSANGLNSGALNYGKVQVFLYPHFNSDIRPSMITFLGENSQEQCGTQKSPERCFAPPLFGQPLNWKIQLYVEPVEAGVLWSRSTNSKFKVISNSNSKSKWSLIEISGKNIEYPDYVFTEIRNQAISDRNKSDFSRDYLVLELNYKSNNYTRYIAEQCVDSIRDNQYIVLSSNAWSMENPKWNSTNNSLEIKLNSPSFDHKGNKTIGYLELEIPQTLAKCLWNLKSDSVSKLDVEVFYDQNNEKQVVSLIQTSSMESIRLIANNFHYSSPTFAFKLPQSEYVSRPPQSSITPGKTMKKITISCNNGKVTKKVSGVNPKCPTGYKKVA